jgi:hypothetical protein
MKQAIHPFAAEPDPCQQGPTRNSSRLGRNSNHWGKAVRWCLLRQIQDMEALQQDLFLQASTGRVCPLQYSLDEPQIIRRDYLAEGWLGENPVLRYECQRPARL